ncbi:MAG: SDR family oxidoreductase [Candidatus Xenobiia bacterium LiM19]
MKKIAIVTGGSSGIGLETGKLLSRQGFTVILAARRESKLREIADAHRDGTPLEFLACDVSDEDSVTAFVQQVKERHGQADVLINSAGIGYRGAIDELPTSRFDEMMHTNVRGVYLCTKHIVPLMKDRQRGHIVNISSGAGKNGIANMAGYCASKFALMGLSESLALEFKPFNIKVSVICPGSTNTDFHLVMNGAHPGEEARQLMIQPEDIARTVLHIITAPESCWVYEVTTRAFLKGRT